jgi:hypothetical protein
MAINKQFMALTLIAAGIIGFTFGPAHAADTNVDTTANNSMDSRAKTNGEARGTANFTMSFSGSATTKGDFDHSGMMQNMFGAENRPYYYSK